GRSRAATSPTTAPIATAVDTWVARRLPPSPMFGQNGAVVVGSAKGKLLVAAPPLADPNFDRTVVYVLEHNEDGALGVVLNRPLDDELVEGLDSWNDLLTPPSVLFEGGPVEPNALI